MNDTVREYLLSQRDEEYAAFQAKLMPTVPAQTVIGVRTPLLRAYAKKLARSPQGEAFLSELPHEYFDENRLHALILSEEKDAEVCIEKLERFLPYIADWSTCDQLSPKAFKSRPARLTECIERWLASDKTYTVRFGIEMLMAHYLDEGFDVRYLERVARIRSEEYYINMMIAWYFATALAKQYNATLPFLLEGRLDVWTHNKTIQKAVESYRITPEQKDYLRSLKRKA